MKRNIIAVAIILTIFGCNSKKEGYVTESASEAKEMQTSDTVVADKIIKTADMRFRVKDVQNTKEKLSQIIRSEGGTVAEFSINSTIQETDKFKLTADSSKEITSYRTDGVLVAKIPAEGLDEFTNAIAKMAVFVDNSSLKLDDQSINYLANKLKGQNRIDASKQIGKIPRKKADNITTSMNLSEESIDRKIDNMNIDAKVKFSTITLNFYQDNTVKTMIVANDNLYDYRPAFGNRLWLNVINGWTIFKEIILALANLWMLVIVGIVAFFTIRYFVRKNKVAMELATRNMMENRQ